MKQIRSGQAFLYRNAGYDSTVIEIRMKDKVTGSYLQVALTNAVRRFPYLTDKLVEKDGRYYTHPDLNAMTVNKTTAFRPLGSASTGFHLVDVTYTGYLIRVAFHHGLCDGRGIKPFVEALLYDYCCPKYHHTFSADGIMGPDEAIDPAETAEPFGRELFPVPDKKPPVSTDGFALPESTSTPTGCFRTELVVDEAVYLKAAKEIGATPAILAAILLSKGIAKQHPQAQKPIVCNLAMDLRSAIGMEKTHRDCVGSAYLPYTQDDVSVSPCALVQKYRELLNAQRAPEMIQAGLNRQIGMFNKLDELQSLDEKRAMLSFFNGMVNNTYVISYLGQLRLNDYADHVESASFYSGGICGLTVNMFSAAGKMTFSVLQGFSENRYVQEFAKMLVPFGLMKISPMEQIVTGKDMSHRTASRQLERYFCKVAKDV